jgi:aspartyl-tRNA(Asn)/glutamyl-tRNA(Gln) amidotransferase subunit A
VDALEELSLLSAVQALRQGDVSSRALTEAYLARIKRFNLSVNAYLTVSPELALQQADAADQSLDDWRRDPTTPLPPLAGLPIAVKDVLCVAGMRCTCGSRILVDFIPPYHATAVERLLAAGVVILGKTNTDEFAMGSSTENSAYGVTRNPWDTQRVPGGSSGGSAAAVAARLALAALGTDTGGSVRQPAAFCGITGLKPTYGRISRYGLVAYGSSLDTVGVLGRSAAELLPLYQVMAGLDPRDMTSLDAPVAEIHLDEKASCRGLRVGIPAEYFVGGVQAEVQEAIQRAITNLEALGTQIIPVSLPHTEHALSVYYLLAPAEASANLARYDGVRYGLRQPASSLWELFSQTRGAGFGAEVKRRIMLGTYALSAGYYEAYYAQAQKVRTLIRQDFERAFAQVDLIAAPVSPTTAFRIGEHSDDPLAMYLEDVFTLPANLAGVPGMAFPVGFDRQELPIGMQLMAPHLREDLLFRATHSFQLTTDWHTRHPPV